jgi:hypothetical protein
MLTRTQALAALTANVALTESLPCLTEVELGEVLDANARAIVWATATVVVPGQLLVPPVASWNGRLYRVIEGGAIPATAPTWPTMRAAYIDQQVSSSPIVLEDNGPAFPELYDLRGAMGDAWLLKCQRAAVQHDYSGGGGKTNASQIFEHCVTMAKAYGKVYVG